MGGGSGTNTSTAQTQQNLAGWAQPAAKAAIASYLNYIFPGSTVPQNYFNQAGFSFPTGGATGAGGTANTSAAAQMLNQIDPTGTAYSMFAPMISGSPFLQQMAQQNPGAVVGAISPMAASQLSNPNIYGSSNPALSWIPGYTSGLGGGGGGAQSGGGTSAAPTSGLGFVTNWGGAPPAGAPPAYANPIAGMTQSFQNYLAGQGQGTGTGGG